MPQSYEEFAKHSFNFHRLSASVKADLILKQEDMIHTLAAQAEQLQMLQDYIQFDFLKGT